MNRKRKRKKKRKRRRKRRRNKTEKAHFSPTSQVCLTKCWPIKGSFFFCKLQLALIFKEKNDFIFKIKIMMQIFRKFFVDNGQRDLLNLFNAYLEAKQILDTNDQSRRATSASSFQK